ncbi:hypothetical protein ACFQZ8_22015, partial [Micromonospora azadirachtae]
MDFQIPSSLDGLDLDALTELENQAVAAFDALRDDPALDADGLARLRELAAFVQSVRTEQARIEQAAEQVASELDDLTATVHGAPEGGDGDGDEGDGGEAEEEPAEE